MRKQRAPVMMSDKTYQMLRAYCRANGSQIRTEIDGLLQFALETKLAIKRTLGVP